MGEDVAVEQGTYELAVPLRVAERMARELVAERDVVARVGARRTKSAWEGHVVAVAVPQEARGVDTWV